MPRHITTQDQLGSLAGVVGTPEDGQVLKWDGDLGAWTPGQGGVEVGAWELNQTFTWTCPPFYEQNMQASPVSISATRAVAPTVSFTVTEDMLVTCDRADVGWEQVMTVSASVDWKTGTGTNIYCYHELVVNGQSIVNTYAGGNAVTDRFSGLWGYRGAKVGDVVQLWLWTAGDMTGVCDWWARQAVPTRHFLPQDINGRYLYTNIREDATTTTPSVGTVFTSKGTITYQGRVNYIFTHRGTNYAAQATVTNANFEMPEVGYGIHQTYVGDRVAQMVTDAAGVYVSWNQVPTRITVDRLLIPTPQPIQ